MSRARRTIGALGLALLLAAPAGATHAGEPVRLKDLGRFQGWRDNALLGFGIVVGLAGTGDSPANRATRQALSNVFSQFNLSIPQEQVQSRNVAVVMVSAALPPFAREGDGLDVNVTSAGDARSLLGGELLLTTLKGPDDKVYALARGPLSVGGFRYDSRGNVVQKNHPTTGSIPNGATVEAGVSGRVLKPDGTITFVLAEPDYATASRVAEAIHARFPSLATEVKDAAGIDISLPEQERAEAPRLLAHLETLTVEPDRRAKVVINERTGTVVSGGDVRISRVAISHGDLKVSVGHDWTVSQPAGAVLPGPGVRTAVVGNTRVEATETGEQTFVEASSETVADLVRSLVRLKTSTRDIISILRALKAAGALHAELVVQ